uniref:VWFC domain-containing protein n=1 Tax=Pseudonaja textilis TaxID=8673 RepID=A0A670XQJ3_PSETE
MPLGPLERLSLALLLAALGGTQPGLAGPVSTCDANGSLYFRGEWYSLDSDPCIQCECTAEGPACARTDCAALPPACIHVSHYPGDCCPRCERVGCEHRGQVYELGQHFQVRQANERCSRLLKIKGS